MSWLDRGWQVFAPEAEVEAWRAIAGPVALRVSADEGQRAAWLRHGKTWFVGVDALPNGPDGAVADAPPLDGAALAEARAVAGALPLHPGQVSVTYPGYPGQDPGESDAAHRFRRDRDAAHLDGLLPVGPEKRRYLREFHAFILGIALTEAAAEASPLVVWEGSHHLVRAAFAKAFDGIPAERLARGRHDRHLPSPAAGGLRDLHPAGGAAGARRDGPGSPARDPRGWRHGPKARWPRRRGAQSSTSVRR